MISKYSAFYSIDHQILKDIVLQNTPFRSYLCMLEGMDHGKVKASSK